MHVNNHLQSMFLEIIGVNINSKEPLCEEI